MQWCRFAVLVAVFGLLKSAAGDSPSTRPADTRPATDRPVVQLTASLPDDFDSADHKQSGDLLLREIQRQAVLLAAREEMGVLTRDMTLDEPFAPKWHDRVTTVVMHTRVVRGETATISLGRAPTTNPSDPAADADLPTTAPAIISRSSTSFLLERTDLPDYTAFVAQCETLSRATLIDGLKAEHVLDGTPAEPTRWVGDGPIGTDAEQWLQCPDVFHQYLAVREMHRQMRAGGASYQRVDALVRAYANLSMLSSSQWSWAIDAFAARALLYAERLKVHEDGSGRSLYTRAYARAIVGLHGGALDDIAAGARGGAVAPPWLPAIDGLCKYDLNKLLELSTAGPWGCRPLAGMFLGIVATDGYPQPTADAVAAQVIADLPGAFFLPETNTGQSTQFIAAAAASLPIVLRTALQESSLPPAIVQAAGELTSTALLSSRPDGYLAIAGLRDQLSAAAGSDSVEPSLGVLAGLVEQQSFAAIVRRAAETSSFGTNDVDGLHNYARLAAPILDRHPWGLMVNYFRTTSNPTPDKDFEKVLARPKPRDNGWWIDTVNSRIVLTDPEQKKLDDFWVTPGHKLSAQTVYQYAGTPDGRTSVMSNVESLWRAYRRSSPYSAALMTAWLASVPRESFLNDKPLYDGVVAEAVGKFSARPDVIDGVVDICELRGDFDRSAELLRDLSMVAPSSRIYERMARTARHFGHRDEAITCIDRGLRIAPTDNNSGANVNQLVLLKARIQADAGLYTDALATLARLEGNNNDNTYLPLEARCYEATGHPDEAETCFRFFGNSSAPTMYQAWFFARRMDRSNADVLKKLATAQGGDQAEPKVMLLLGDGADAKAMEVLKGQDQLGYGLQLERLVLAEELKMPNEAKAAVNQIVAGNLLLGRAVRQVVDAKDLGVALAAFDRFEADQLNPEELVRYDSAIGRYLIAAGHRDAGVRYLKRALRRPDHEQDGYFLAWLAAGKLGLDPAVLARP
jgi:tetratricopeptide (TPR) repeat protein